MIKLIANIVGCVAVVLLAFAALAQTQSVTGTPRIINGDTLKVSGTRIRLHGIDAPESLQTYKDTKGKSWDCGAYTNHITANNLS